MTRYSPGRHAATFQWERITAFQWANGGSLALCWTCLIKRAGLALFSGVGTGAGQARSRLQGTLASAEAGEEVWQEARWGREEREYLKRER